MEYRTDESGLQRPGRNAGARPAEQAAGPAGDTAAGAVPDGAPAAAAGEPGLESGEQRPLTGEPRVDAALARLDELPELPVTEHRAVFEHVHRSLSEVLGELDTGLPLDTGGSGEGAGGAGGAERRQS